MDVSLRQIRAFVCVGQLKSFTRAAAVLNLAQPTLTVQIRSLEAALGVRLLDRTSRSVDLTRVGRELLPVFGRILGDLDTALLGIRDLTKQQRGIVRIAILPSVAASTLPDAIRTFREDYPGATFALKDAIASRVLALVRSDEVDCGVMGGEVTDPAFEVLFRANDQMHIIYPNGHALAGLSRITINAIAAYPLILMDPGTSVRAIVDAAFSSAGRTPRISGEATYMMTAVSMVRAGLGLTILPGTAREIVAEPSLRSRPIDDPLLSRPVLILKKAGRTLPPLSEAFVHHLARTLSPTP